ncbi:MAG: YciI-like protein [Balneolaceae bacterium]
MHYLLIYELAPNYLDTRGTYRDDHLRLAWEAQKSGDLVLGGALQEPSDRAVLMFKGDTPDAARKFAEKDPYVNNGLVVSWEIRPWMTVVGDEAVKKVFPSE